jgi:hypothetical protein
MSRILERTDEGKVTTQHNTTQHISHIFSTQHIFNLFVSIETEINEMK